MFPENFLQREWMDILEQQKSAPQEDRVLDTIRTLAMAVDSKDRYTIRHSWRVSRLASALAASLAWPEDYVQIVELAGLLHDIGKIAILDAILLKNGQLEGEERLAMQRHPEIGAQLIMGFDFLAPVIPYILYHHERWDGGGYPFGLMGEEIPQEGRLMALCDAFDAMVTTRPYRTALDTEVAIQELLKNKASQFDPQYLDAFSFSWKAGKIAEALEDPLMKPLNKQS
jgi:putative nucleotidyltransferase with HDIG domain